MTTKDFDPTASNAHMVYVPVAIFSILCPSLTATRIWSRLRKGGQVGADDYAIVAALIFSLLSSGVEVASCHFGFGRHVQTLEPEDIAEALKFFYLCQITYKACINLTKCSILLLYLRIFGKIRWFKWLCRILLLIIFLYCVASVIVTIFQCTPVQRAYNRAIEGTCIDSGKFWYANAGFSITTDLVILVMPMALVYQLQIQRAQKVALVIVFALGGFVVITSCLRVTTINIASTTHDVTYDISSTMWTIIEMNVAIICACLPMIRPIIVRLFPKLMPKSSGNSNEQSESGDYLKSLSQSQSRGDKNEWVQIDGNEGIHMNSVKKSGSACSNESILETTVESGPSSAGTNWTIQQGAIQKTMQYSIEYTQK
ncbi:hypothetical protein BGZ63DRAFT_450305 [Mariannaea sp. PMI_226]|nr:hypothetical protein BGZ63DRAFT_450305 [Mariannaea sp. PMI_226]